VAGDDHRGIFLSFGQQPEKDEKAITSNAYRKIGHMSQIKPSEVSEILKKQIEFRANNLIKLII
jgi:hypothetical protein